MKNIGLLLSILIFTVMFVILTADCQATETTSPDITLNQVGSDLDDLKIYVNHSYNYGSSCKINVTVEDKDEERMGRDIHLHEDRNKIVDIANTIYFCKFTASETGDYYNISCWIVHKGNHWKKIKAAIYSDSSGPEDLLGETNELESFYWPNVTNRWFNFGLTQPVTLTQNTDYWLAITSEGNSLRGAYITYNQTSTTNQVAYISNDYEDGFPQEVSSVDYKSDMILDIYANMTKTASGVDSVMLQWYNGNSWDSDVSMTQSGGYYEITKSSLSSGNWYSFNVTAEDIDGNQRKYSFTRYNPEINDSSRIFFQCGCANNPYKYNSDWILYINNASYENPETNIVGDYGENQVNALRHGQSTNGTLDDTGYLRNIIPIDPAERHCSAYWACSFDKDVTFSSDWTLNNIYIHFWISNGTELGKNKIIYGRTYKEDQTLAAFSKDWIYDKGYGEWHTEDVSSNIRFSREIEGSFNEGADYRLVTKKIDTTEMTDNTFDSNSIYSYFVGQKYDGIYDPGPASFCNESFQSFVLCNIPNNATLKSYDNDSDDLSDYEELFITYTNPFVSDTDADGLSDHIENLSGSNPNNYSDTISLMNSASINIGWNFVSLPKNVSMEKSKLVIKYNGHYFSWSEGVANSYVGNFVFGWDRNTQSYTFNETFSPGAGYWLYAYEDCELWVRDIDVVEGDLITNVKTEWNIIGIPYDQQVEKTDVLVDEISWITAVDYGWISDYVFGWNQVIQSYQFIDTFFPGSAYWMYAYSPRVLEMIDSKDGGTGTNNSTGDNFIWQMEIDITETSNNISSLIYFGESPDALDGNQTDRYDAPAPPTPPEPYIYAYFDNNQSAPVDKLIADYRTWADKEKTWNLTVSYVSDTESNTSVNLSWNKTLFLESEYNTILLFDNSMNSTVNMLTQAWYQFNMTVNTTIDFQVLCSNGTLPIFENITASPSTGGFGENITISADVYHLFNNISTVKVNVTYPDNSTNNFTMTNTFNDTYQYGFDDTWQIGTYEYYLWATDTQDNSSYTTQYDFSITVNATIQVCTINNTYTSADDINITDPPTPSTLYDIGYELLDYNQVLHMWNLYDSYYFDIDNGIQLTNHKDEYWSRNVLMLGYYNNDEWNLIYRTDELSGFQKSVETDNQTYVNATLWKDLAYQGYEFRLAIRYHLGLEDNELTVIPYIENLGYPILYTLGFAWEINDIKIDDTPENDYILINDSYYWLNESLDFSFTNLSKPVYCWNEILNESIVCGYEPIPYFHVQENISDNAVRSLYLRWNQNLNYKVWIQSQNDSYNAPIMLGIQIGTLDSGESKQISLYWYDADQQIFYFDTNSSFETWTSNPGYMVDNNTAMFATTSTLNDVQKLTGNTCPEIDPGSISKVEMRAFGKRDQCSCSVLLRPVFRDGDGDDHKFMLPLSASWSEWFDITDDSNAPSWTWEDVSTFDCDVESSNFSEIRATVYCAKVEIRVTYSPWTPPSITNPTPGFGSTNVSIHPRLGITVSDDNGDSLDISWLSNSSGSWQVFATNNSVSNGTYYQTFEGANVNGQWWYWRLNVSDDHDYNLSSVFKFYTGNQSKLVNTGSTTIKGYLLMQVEYWNGTAWTLDQVVIDDSSPRVFNATDVLGLDTVFNGLLDTGDLHYGDGSYRAYAALCDPYSEVLEIDREKLEAWWRFELDLI